MILWLTSRWPQFDLRVFIVESLLLSMKQHKLVWLIKVLLF